MTNKNSNSSLDGSRSQKVDRHIFLSDLQIPDHNNKALEAVYKFIEDFAPDYLHLVGDLLNFTKISSFDTPSDYRIDLADEINTGREVIGRLVAIAQQANPSVQVIWYEGNHEYRLFKYLSKNADQVANLLNDDGERLVSIPSIFMLKQAGIQWIPYYDNGTIAGLDEVIVEHGDMVRSKGGFTAHAMLDRRGKSGLSGHTHRLSLIMRTQMEHTRFWIETGSLCNPEPNPRYAAKPDWQNGFATGIYSHATKLFYPTAVPMFHNTFSYAGKIYTPERWAYGD